MRRGPLAWLALLPLLAALACGGSGGEPAGPVEIVLGEADGAALEVRGVRSLPRGQEAALRVYTGKHATPPAGQPAVLGRLEDAGDHLRFVPRFAFEPGLDYTAFWQGPGPVVVTTFALAAVRREPSTRVVAVYPSGDEVPANLLRVYLHFSAPMSRGEAAARVRLVGGDGQVIAGPFVAPDHELWNPASDRLTLLLDPGRIKREVGPNLAVGPPLTQGREVRLVVDAAWLDAEGTPLAAAFEKLWRVGAPDRHSPAPATWRLDPPTGPEGALEIAFDGPLDHALALRLLTVRGPGDEALDGIAAIAPAEGSWSFQPSGPWQPGTHQLEVDPALEDPSGNSVARPFETAVGAGDGGGEAEAVRIAFEVAGG